VLLREIDIVLEYPVFQAFGSLRIGLKTMNPPTIIEIGRD
jgi:hypothetical protein